MTRPVVVKLGGSLSQSGLLKALLADVDQLAGPVVVVPGGGPFADLVRADQLRLGYSDATAHRLALLAMEQMAWAMVDQASTLEPAASRGEIEAALGRGRKPIWLATHMALAAGDIAQSWETTSDGLAAWLALALAAKGVVLVKSCAVPEAAEAADLCAAGIVDPMFADLAETGRLAWRVVNGSRPGALAAAVAQLIQSD